MQLTNFVSFLKKNYWWLIIATIILLTILFYMFWDNIKAEHEVFTTKNTAKSYLNNANYPRGIRNNNIGNLRKSKEPWRGKIANGKDASFEQFETFVWGVRAQIKLLKGYIKGGANTISKIVAKYAPNSDAGNDETQYKNVIAKATGKAVDTVISSNDKETIWGISYAMFLQENGKQYDGKGIYTRQDFDLAWNLI